MHIRVVFDITQAFRSIPLISVLTVAYLWSARNVQLHAIVYIDLRLFNRRLRCLVAIDLILGAFRHEYPGAMNFYLNYLKAEQTEADERDPIGILLCSDKNDTHVESALGGLSNRVFVSR